MTEQNLNPRQISKSCLALSDALDRLLDYIEKTFDLSVDEAMWFLASILHKQPQAVHDDPEAKALYAAWALHIKQHQWTENTEQPISNDQN